MAASRGAGEGICPRAPVEGDAEKGFGDFFRHEICKKLCDLCWGTNGHGRTNHVHRTMHILDVINSVSRSSKCIKIVGGLGFAPDLTGGAYSAPQTP